MEKVMTDSYDLRKKHILCLILLPLTALLMTGCSPEEKTMLLPKAQSSEEESEGVDPSRDFTVKKIYTYSYETSELLLKSAYLKGCGENQVHINALDDKHEDVLLVYRQVDYRYGFYDTLGELIRFWEDWNNPSGGSMESDLYIDSLLPSPDGKQLLIYIRSAFWDSSMVWLQTLGTPEPWLLYEGTSGQGDPMIGAFSPSGSWVTFDAAGSSSSDECMVPIYDCGKTEFVEEDQYLEFRRDPKINSASGHLYSRLYPPDQTLFASSDVSSKQPWSATLCDTSNGPGLLTFFREEDKNLLSFEMQQRLTPDDGQTQYSDYIDSSSIFHISSYLYNYDGMSYLQYKQQTEPENSFYYMGNPLQLVHAEMSEPFKEYAVSFSDPVWDFLPLDTGDFLVLLVQEVGLNGNDYINTPETTANNAEGNYKYIENGAATPLFIQNYWDIQSADLYLYPAEGTEGRLLYKNVQNLLGMEYDAENRRILLETYESGNLSHRKCIILEL